MMSDACLVTDGNLVIDSKFRTNDSDIYAAGSCTKFARHYYAPNTNYNSKSVGKELAKVFMNDNLRKKYSLLDPNGDISQLPDISETIVPVLDDLPLQRHAFLPGGIEILDLSHATKKGSRIIKSPSNFPDSEDSRNVFEIHVDDKGEIVRIFAARGDGNRIHCDDLKAIFGLHERIVDNLVFKSDKKPEDLFTFLKNPAMKSLFHDKFGDLLNESMRKF